MLNDFLCIFVDDCETVEFEKVDNLSEFNILNVIVNDGFKYIESFDDLEERIFEYRDIMVDEDSKILLMEKWEELKRVGTKLIEEKGDVNICGSVGWDEECICCIAVMISKV